MLLLNSHRSASPSQHLDAAERVFQSRAFRRLKKRPRYQPFSLDLFGTTIRGCDGPSFYHSFREIFVDRIYDFDSESSSPRIVDGGSNVGLSILFFKFRYPDARVVGFEPSRTVFPTLQHNVAACGLEHVELVEKALWTEATELTFHQDGADAGHLSDQAESDTGDLITVPTCSLRPFLDQPVDFLKLDIEGAEIDVLLDCREPLKRVRNLFVEYHSFADQPQRLDDLTGVLIDAGFRIQLHTQFASQQPFRLRRRQYGMDLQLNVFAFRP